MRAVLAALLVLAASLPAQASRPADELEKLLDRRLQPLLAKKQIIGAAVGTFDGTSDGNAQRELCYGKRAAGSDAPVDATTLFEIGSITKVFTGILLADLVAGGTVALDDEVKKHLPPTVALREKGRPIRLVDLATHSSGLPRLPANLGAAPLDPYVVYSKEDLYEFLGKWAPTEAPGASSSYSNLGVGLLGHLLARASGTPFEELLVARICAPLGMRDTRIHLDDRQLARLARGHDQRGKPTHAWGFDVLAPCGGLRSSLSDLLLFLRANLGADATTLAGALARSHEVAFERGRQRLGLCWHFDKIGAHDVLWHNGGTGGFRSWLGFCVPKRAGVVVLVNSTMDIDSIGRDALELLLARAPEGASGSRPGRGR